MDSGLNYRRIRRITIEPEVLKMMLTEGSQFRVKKGIPDGATFMGAQGGLFPGDFITIYFQHSSFEPGPRGDAYPRNRN